VIGPGSLYTSVLAALAVPGIRAAVAASPAQVVYVCNLRPQVPETERYDVDAHLQALRDHGVEPDVVVRRHPPSRRTVGHTIPRHWPKRCKRCWGREPR